MQQTTTFSDAAPGASPRATGRQRVAVGTVALLVIAGAIAVRQWLAPVVPQRDALRGDSDEAVAALSARMDKMPPTDRVNALKRYVNEAGPSLRYAAVDQLGEGYHTPDLAPLLERTYADSSSIVRQRVLETLPDADGARGQHLLLAALRDEDTWMREAAAVQLKMRARAPRPVIDQRALPSLIAALDDADPVVPFTITSVLRQMTGKPWHYRSLAAPAEKAKVHAQWKAWWKQQPGARLPEVVSPVVPTRIDPAPPFLLHDLDGQAISLVTQQGRLTLLNFWGTWCPPCQAEVPDLIRLDKEYRKQGVDVIGVAVGEKGAPAVRDWCTAHGVMYRQALAVERVQRDYGNIFEVPVSVLIDGEGRVRRRWEGERDYATFQAAIENVRRQDAKGL